MRLIFYHKQHCLLKLAKKERTKCKYYSQHLEYTSKQGDIMLFYLSLKKNLCIHSYIAQHIFSIVQTSNPLPPTNIIEEIFSTYSLVQLFVRLILGLKTYIINFECLLYTADDLKCPKQLFPLPFCTFKYKSFLF